VKQLGAGGLFSCAVHLRLQIDPLGTGQIQLPQHTIAVAYRCMFDCKYVVFTFLVMTANCAVVQAFNIRFPTAAAQVRPQVKSCGICVGQSDIGVDFFAEYSCFSCQYFVLPITPQ
jgi:hypothetical protein